MQEVQPDRRAAAGDGSAGEPRGAAPASRRRLGGLCPGRVGCRAGVLPAVGSCLRVPRGPVPAGARRPVPRRAVRWDSAAAGEPRPGMHLGHRLPELAKLFSSSPVCFLVCFFGFFFCIKVGDDLTACRI